MGSNDSALKRYIRSISDSLPCTGKMKRQVISQIRSSIVDYLQENPDVDFEAVQSHFGTPQEIAAGYVDDQDTSALLRKMSIKKKVLLMVASAMAVFILIWTGVVAWAVMDAWDSTRGHTDAFVERNYFQSNDIGGPVS